jgi:hypothetical protein
MTWFELECGVYCTGMSNLFYDFSHSVKVAWGATDRLLFLCLNVKILDCP